MAKHRVAATSYNMARVFSIRDHLMNEVLSEFLGLDLAGEWFDYLVSKLSESLQVREAVIYDSVRYLAGNLLSRPKAFALAWQLAGNIDRLRSGRPVPKWSIQAEEEWLPVQVLDWRADRNARGKPVNLYELRIIAGTACPNRTTAYWSSGFVRMIARQMGFSNRHGKLPFQHPSELVQLRLRLLADPARSKPGQLGFWEVGSSPGLNKWNQGILRMRVRIGFTCPESFTHCCYRCPAGYDVCPAAARRETIYAIGSTESGAQATSVELAGANERSVERVGAHCGLPTDTAVAGEAGDSADPVNAVRR